VKIIFNCLSTGCGPNGGTHTIVQSANILKKLDNDVIIIDSGKNKYTWDKLLVPHIILHDLNHVPEAHVVVSTGYNSVKSTLALPKKCGVKLHWMRAWELWKMNEKMISQKILNVPTIKIVNSICLQNRLNEYKIKSYIIRPGNNFNEYYPLNIRGKNNKIILGGLYNVSHSTKRTDWILKVTEILKKNNKNILLYMF
jgi:hypothetical protein